MLGKIVDYLKFDVRYGVHEITDGVLRTADPEIVVPLEEVLKH